MRSVLREVVGNDTLKSKILNDVSSDTLSHAYMIEGKRGSGRHTIAKMIAASLSCERKNDKSAPLPCGECLSCRKIFEGNSPDVITIGREDKASIGVDTIRFLRNDIRVVPNDLDYKVYIIEDADTMTLQAQNAFLLALEEPPMFVKYFLICEDSDSLLETIRSRAQKLRTEPIANEDIDTYLCEHYPEAQRMKRAEPDAYGELIMASENSIGSAVEMLDPKHFKHVLEDRMIAKELVSLISSGRRSDETISLISRFDGKRESLTRQLSCVLLALRDLIVLQKSEAATLLFYYDRESAISLTDTLSLRRLFNVYDSVTATLDAISVNANVRLSLIKLFSDIGLI